MDTRKILRKILYEDTLNEIGLKKRLRQHFPHIKHTRRDKDLTIKQMHLAYDRAQKLNSAHEDGVTVYHMISPYRVKSPLFSVIDYLFSKDSHTEISVSTSSIWDVAESIVLVGKSKLLMLFHNDAYTAPIKGYKIPQSFSKSSEDWNESIIRLSDVKWDTLYIGADLTSDEDLLGAFNVTTNELETYVSDKYPELDVKTSSNSSNPIVKYQNVKETILSHWDEAIEDILYTIQIGSRGRYVFDLYDEEEEPPVLYRKYEISYVLNDNIQFEPMLTMLYNTGWKTDSGSRMQSWNVQRVSHDVESGESFALYNTVYENDTINLTIQIIIQKHNEIIFTTDKDKLYKV